MAAALTVTVTRPRNTGTAALTGGPASANVVFSINDPGCGTLTIAATTNGSGAATVNFTPQGPGTVSVSVLGPQPTTAIAGPVTGQVA
jgi:hypothetical protein